jgi:PiT family inorganic phosphate transporter
MTTIPSADIVSTPSEIARPRLDHPMGIRTILIFFAIMALGLYFTAYSIHKDLTAASTPVTSYLPFLLLGVALLIELGFEFVNGFHDTANAVATVIYTRWLRRSPWCGRAASISSVYYSRPARSLSALSLLPVELIMQVGSEAGYAMVFAMLIAAIIWNLGTWWLGCRPRVRTL